MTRTRPNCKVGDTLRVDSDEWDTIYPRGTEGIVTEVDEDIVVQVSKIPEGGRRPELVGCVSYWWGGTATNAYKGNQPKLSIVLEITDEEIEDARAGLKALLDG